MHHARCRVRKDYPQVQKADEETKRKGYSPGIRQSPFLYYPLVISTASHADNLHQTGTPVTIGHSEQALIPIVNTLHLRQLQFFLQEDTCVAFFYFNNIFWCAVRYYFAATSATFWAHVYNIVSYFYHIHIVFDH